LAGTWPWAGARLVPVPAGEARAGSRARLPGTWRNRAEPAGARLPGVGRPLVCLTRVRRARASPPRGTVGGIPVRPAAVLLMETWQVVVGFGNGRLTHGEADA